MADMKMLNFLLKVTKLDKIRNKQISKKVKHIKVYG